MPTKSKTRARKSPKKPAASRRCAEATGSGPLTPDEQEVLSAYRALRDDPDLAQPFIEDIQSDIDLPNDRTLTLTIHKPSDPVDADGDDRDPRRGDDDE